MDLKRRLADGETLVGTMVTLPCPATIEILAELGFDWLFVDGEHGPLETGELLSLLQVVGDRVPCLVRVPAVDEVSIKKVLDIGAAGIIVPQVNTVAQAERVIAAAYYAPQGSRGVGLARAHGYGLRFAEYVEQANSETVVVVQAEHAEAVDNIESITKVPGIDAILLGPYDLAASLGKMGQVNDPIVVAAIDRIAAACEAAALPLGYFGVDAAAVEPYIERGCRLIVAGVDTLLFGQAASRLLSELRDRFPCGRSGTSSDSG